MSHRILLIEDDEDLLNLYRIALEKAGFEVVVGVNGLEGISASLKQSVDLVLLDLMMPLADGRDVLAMLRLNQKTKEVPIIIMSNLNRDTFDLSLLDDQVIDYWIKSEITPKILTDRLVSFFS